MEINIPTNITKIHEQYLTFMNIFFNLTPNEIKLISAILTIYKETEGAKENIRWGYVFSKEGKGLIEQHSGMNKNQINLTLSALSKKEYQGNPILEKTPYRAITEGLRVDPINNPYIKINFVFVETIKKMVLSPKQKNLIIEIGKKYQLSPEESLRLWSLQFHLTRAKIQKSIVVTSQNEYLQDTFPVIMLSKFGKFIPITSKIQKRNEYILKNDK